MKALLAAATVTLAFAIAAPAGATTPPTPCKTPAGFLCGTLTVPIDRAGSVPGTIDLHYAIQASGPAPILLDLAGGPGQSELKLAGLVADSVKPLLSRYRLAVLDQRGTGGSGALDCPALQDEGIPQPSTVADCAASIGPARAFYTTVDSVLDIEDLRAALNVPTLAISGTSYGTYVATQYARAFPAHVDRLVLNSTVGLDGIGSFYQERFGALPRMLSDLCAKGACGGATPSPVADLAKAAHSLQAGHALRGVVYDTKGRSHRFKVGNDEELAAVLLATDAVPGLAAQMPGALRAAAQGDASPLLRILSTISGGITGDQEAFMAQSEALYAATVCQDTPLPFGIDSPPGARPALVSQALNALPRSAYAPFSPHTVLELSISRSCEKWPATAPRARYTGPLPDVPTLIFGGSLDLRTPLETAAAVAKGFPRAQVVPLTGAGHDVIDTGAPCVGVALQRFAADQPVGTPCAGVDINRPIAPRAPTSLSAVTPARGVRGTQGRVVAAVRATLVDVARTLDLAGSNLVRLAGGGLRGGSWTTRHDDPATLKLTRYAYIPGVQVSGSPHPNAKGFSGVLRISGKLSGTLTVNRTFHLRGTLGGVKVSS